MISLFFGLTGANLLLLGTVFCLGLTVRDVDGQLTGVYAYHIAIAIAAGLMTTLTHVATYVYFMGTSKWLEAATDKAGLDPQLYAGPAMGHKSRAFGFVMLAIVVTMLTMFAGAGADRTYVPWWPSEVHLGMGVATLVVNFYCATALHRLIVKQGALMDGALGVLNQLPGVEVKHV